MCSLQTVSGVKQVETGEQEVNKQSEQVGGERSSDVVCSRDVQRKLKCTKL